MRPLAEVKALTRDDGYWHFGQLDVFHFCGQQHFGRHWIIANYQQRWLIFVCHFGWNQGDTQWR
jgi:hypothetical protein